MATAVERAAIKNPEAAVAARYYDAVHRRLVYLGEEATPEMWDALWAADDSIRRVLQPSWGSRWLVRLTRRYLRPEDGRIIEGGCGLGQFVAALHRQGYEVTGIDSAPKTVDALQRVAPELDIRLGDVTELPFAEASCAGYWSLGLIEHHFDGFGPLAVEMARVIRPGGYLFLSFPFMSPVRRLKASLGCYAPFTGTTAPRGFYQFALDRRRVAEEFRGNGFGLRAVKSLSGLKGCKDEVGLLKPPLDWLYHYPGRALVPRALRLLADPVLAAAGCGHSCVLVLQRS